MTPLALPEGSLDALEAPRRLYQPCLQSLDLGGPILRTIPWPRHAWVLDAQEITLSKREDAVLARTWRCLRCGETWTISGEPAPGVGLW